MRGEPSQPDLDRSDAEDGDEVEFDMDESGDHAVAAPSEASDDGASADPDPDEVAAEAADDEAEAQDGEAEAAAADDEGDDDEDDEAQIVIPEDPRALRIRVLEAMVEAREDTLREYIAARKQEQADLDRFKKRLERDQEGAVIASTASAVGELLDVLDNLHRTLEAARAGGDMSSFVQGVAMVEAQFRAALEGLGVTRLDPTGEIFDPARMNALAVIPVEDDEQDNVVIATLQPGYAIGDREIRPALVHVGRKS